MATIRQMRERWQAVNVTEEAKEVLADNSQEVVSLLQEQLYQSGMNGDNQLNPGYSPYSESSGYLRDKGNPRISQAGDPYDYKNTGSFYEKMFLKLEGGSMEIDSSDAKTTILPSSIRRLDTVSKNGLRKNILQPGMVRSIAQKTGCGTG
jgi:hypothetical protein